MSSEKQFLKGLKHCKPDIVNIKLTPLTPACQRQWQDDLISGLQSQFQSNQKYILRPYLKQGKKSFSQK